MFPIPFSQLDVKRGAQCIAIMQLFIHMRNGEYCGGGGGMWEELHLPAFLSFTAFWDRTFICWSHGIRAHWRKNILLKYVDYNKIGKGDRSRSPLFCVLFYIKALLQFPFSKERHRPLFFWHEKLWTGEVEGKSQLRISDCFSSWMQLWGWEK